MDKDLVIVVRVVLAAVVYGIANLIGNVGHFVPPMIIDPLLVVVAGTIFIFRSPRPPFHYMWPLLVMMIFFVLQAYLDPGVRGFLNNSIDIQLQISETPEKEWLYGLAILLLIAMITIVVYWRLVVYSVSGKTIRILFLLFVIVQVMSVIFAMKGWDGKPILVASLLVTSSLLFRWSHLSPNVMQRGLFRAISLIWLAQWLDVLQVIAYAGLRV